VARGSVSDLLEQLAVRELLPPSQIEEARKELVARFADAHALSAELVRRQWLTAFQANKLLQGKADELVIGPYRLLARLGEGGMGQVYKARHARMERIVALKVVDRERLTSANAIERFLREVKAVAQLQHPNIVLAYDYGEDEGRHYYAMEYVEGQDLARLVKERGPLPIRDGCDLIRQAVVGLQHAHERGLVHRDLKPANLLLSPARKGGHEGIGTIKILDFGLARFASETRSAGNLTQIGRIVGTVDYISPEQAGDPRKADIRSDIYSLGCCLFCLLVGRPPFEGADMVARIAARVLGDAPPLRSLRKDAPAALEQVLARMLERDPRRRYSTPAEVAAALEPFTKAGGQAPKLKTAAVAVAPAVNVVPVQLEAIAVRPSSARADVAPVESSDDLLIVQRRSRARGIGWGWIGAVCAAITLIGGGVGYWIHHRTGEKPSDEEAAPPILFSEVKPRPQPAHDRKTDARPEPKPKATVDEPGAEPKAEPKPNPKSTPKPDSQPVAPPQANPGPKPVASSGPEPVPPPQLIAEASREPAPKVVSNPGNPADPRTPVPEGARLTEAEAAIRDLYKEDYKKVKHSEMSAFADRLLEQADNAKDDPTTRYVLLREASDVAARAADADLAFKAIEALAHDFAVDGRTMKIVALEKSAREAHTPERSETLAETAVSLIEEATSADHYVEAVRLAKLAESAAYRSGSKSLISSTMARRKDLEQLQKAHTDLKPALTVLAEKSDDPDANLAMGRFLCLLKGDWTQGLTHLVQCGDERLQELARMELGGIETAKQEAELAAAWREQARKERGPARNQLLLHALALYKKALPELGSTLKIKAEKMVAEIEKELPTEAMPEPPGARFRGRWLVPFASRVIREYLIDAKGNVEYLREGTIDAKGRIINPREIKRSAKVIKQGNDFLVDFQDGTLERLSLKNGGLIVEHFDPKDQYPKGRPSLVATCVRAR
jgi:serine/threonine protein kinase